MAVTASEMRAEPSPAGGVKVIGRAAGRAGLAATAVAKPVPAPALIVQLRAEPGQRLPESEPRVAVRVIEAIAAASAAVPPAAVMRTSRSAVPPRGTGPLVPAARARATAATGAGSPTSIVAVRKSGPLARRKAAAVSA